MIYIPFFARLNLTEYTALIFSFFLVGLEATIRILALALPSSVISLFYKASRKLFDCLNTSRSHKPDTRRSNNSTSIRKASDFIDLCALFGYYAEEHVVQTSDGYMLGIHRLAWKKGEERHPVNYNLKGIRKNVVYLHHGLLMNSEVWVCLTDEQRCLPFRLVELGYDVWLGNNRGNKYSKKNLHHSPNSLPFWNFSMDQFVFHDIPDTIQYIVETTSAKSLSYIGFSQGTAQAFATLAVHPKLNKQVNIFIALAPAMSPAGLSNKFVDAIIKASPQCLFLLFGHRSILSSTTTWQSILYPPLYCRLIDMALSFLFGWHVCNISTSQKLAAYSHLYSFTSTKSVVHWFQIMQAKSFRMYDDDRAKVLTLGISDKFTKVAKFPTRNIKSPICLIYGGSDSLVDIRDMLRELPSHTATIKIPHYEHLDFLWAREVDSLVFPHIFDALENHTEREDHMVSCDQECSHHITINGNKKASSLCPSLEPEDSLGEISEAPTHKDFQMRNHFNSEGNFQSGEINETPSNITYDGGSHFERGENSSFDTIIGTPTSIAFQSSLPRPSCNVRKRTRAYKDHADVSEESAHVLSPKQATEDVANADQPTMIALDGHEEIHGLNIGSVNTDNSINNKNTTLSNKLFTAKASPANGFLNDFYVKNGMINRYLHDGGRATAKTMSYRRGKLDTKKK